jgi:hypothetical protein
MPPRFLLRIVREKEDRLRLSHHTRSLLSFRSKSRAFGNNVQEAQRNFVELRGSKEQLGRSKVRFTDFQSLLCFAHFTTNAALLYRRDQRMSKRGRAAVFAAEGKSVTIIAPSQSLNLLSGSTTELSGKTQVNSDEILLRNFRCFDSIINTLQTRKAPILIEA